MTDYLICGELYSLLAIVISPDAYRAAGRRQPIVPWLGTILTIIAWPFAVAITAFFVVQILRGVR